MTLKLFELVGTDEARPFSPFCWRTRMALAHKGLLAETIPWCLTEKDVIAPHQSEKVPVLLDGDIAVVDSWTIANYLEDTYPDRPSLFGGKGGRAVGCMLNWWGDVIVMAGLFPVIVVDIFSQLKPVDAAYFRKSREARLGKRLEEVAAGRDKTVEDFRKLLEPLRLTLKTQAISAAKRRTMPTISCSARSSWRAWSVRSSCWPRTTRSMSGASGYSTRSRAWRGRRRDIRCEKSSE
jgi:glutathione S-transferase